MRKLVQIIGRLVGGKTFAETEQFRRGLDKYLAWWALAIGTVISLVILGDLWCIWVGIIAGAIFAWAGSLWFVNSSRHARDAWILEHKIASVSNEKKRLKLSFELTIKRGLVETDRMWGMAGLTLSAGVFGLTLLIATIGGHN